MNLFKINKELYQEIIEFLIRAKRQTYAGKGQETKASRPNSHDLEYCEDDLKYIDSYLGGLNFAGEEAIWYKDTPIWAMNYTGRVVSEGFSGDFLKEALLLVTEDNPYRGPKEYKKDRYLYKCTVAGDFKWFIGNEEIFFDNKKVYECRFSGSAIN